MCLPSDASYDAELLWARSCDDLLFAPALQHLSNSSQTLKFSHIQAAPPSVLTSVTVDRGSE